MGLTEGVLGPWHSCSSISCGWRDRGLEKPSTLKPRKKSHLLQVEVVRGHHLHQDDAQDGAQQPGLHRVSELPVPVPPAPGLISGRGVAGCATACASSADLAPDSSGGVRPGPMTPTATMGGGSTGLNSWRHHLPGLGTVVDTASGPVWGPESRTRPPYSPEQHGTISHPRRA